MRTAIGFFLYLFLVPTIASGTDREGGYNTGDTFKDCKMCPEMIVVPPRRFIIGSPRNEKGRYLNEEPRLQVTIPTPFAVGKNEVTRGEFAHFVRESGYSAGGNCHIWIGVGVKKLHKVPSASWDNPYISQTDDHPVVCVSWNDAQAYVKWLSRKAGTEFRYRLLSETEWEYVTRAGTTSPYWWGASPSNGCKKMNGPDLSLTEQYVVSKYVACRDGYVHTAPVGSYETNPFGLNDTSGNVWEWVEDCWHSNYSKAPPEFTLGWSWIESNCQHRVHRGGAWGSTWQDLRSAKRTASSPDYRSFLIGFRVARQLTK